MGLALRPEVRTQPEAGGRGKGGDSREVKGGAAPRTDSHFRKHEHQINRLAGLLPPRTVRTTEKKRILSTFAPGIEYLELLLPKRKEGAPKKYNDEVSLF